MTVVFLILAALTPLSTDNKIYPLDRGQWEPVPEFTDAFEEGRPDSDKWYDHDPQWQGRKPGYFSRNNVSINSGLLTLEARKEDLPELPEGYHTFATAAVKSKTPVLYGFFEAKCKPMAARVCSAFWFYNATPELWTEIDVFEIGGAVPGKERIHHMNAHVFHTPDYRGTIEEHLQFPATWESPEDLAGAFHLYALEWNEKEINWYVDRELKYTLKNEHWHQPLYLMFDCETMPEWFGLPDETELPGRFQIEFVRTWRKKESEEQISTE